MSSEGVSDGATEVHHHAPEVPLSEKERRSCDRSFQQTAVAFLQGNALEVALGLALGLVFTQLLSSLVADLLLPAILCSVGPRSLRDRFVVCRRDRYRSVAELVAAGRVVAGQVRTVEEAEQEGIDVFVRPDSLAQAQDLGLNTLNWGRFVQVMATFAITVTLLALLGLALQRARCHRKIRQHHEADRQRSALAARTEPPSTKPPTYDV